MVRLDGTPTSAATTTPINYTGADRLPDLLHRQVAPARGRLCL